MSMPMLGATNFGFGFGGLDLFTLVQAQAAAAQAALGTQSLEAFGGLGDMMAFNVDRHSGPVVVAPPAPIVPNGGEVLRLRGLPWTAGPREIATFLAEYGVKEKDVTMCDKDDGRQSGMAWVIFGDKEKAKKAVEDKHKQSLGGRYIEVFFWRDHQMGKRLTSPTSNQKLIVGVLKQYDAARKAGFILCEDAELDGQDIYAYKDVLERGNASVGDIVCFPLHWSPKGQPQASSPMIRLSAAKTFAHIGIFTTSTSGPSGSGFISNEAFKAVFGRDVYVSPRIAALSGVSHGSSVAFNAYLVTMPSAFSRSILGEDPAPVASSVVKAPPGFEIPGPSLNETAFAPGFEGSMPKRLKGAGKGAQDMMPLMSMPMVYGQYF